MKKVFLTLAIIGGSLLSYSQVSYRLIEDEPSNIKDNYLYLYYFDFQGGLLSKKNNAQGSGGVSLDATVKLASKLYAEGFFKVSFFGEDKAFNKLPMKFSGGVSIPIKSTIKEGDVDVVHSEYITKVTVVDQNDIYQGKVDGIVQKVMKIPGHYKHTHYLHGGVYYQGGTFDTGLTGAGKYTSAGIYAGYVKEKRANLIIQLEDETYRRSSQYFKYYADVTVLPIAKTSFTYTGPKSVIGFRFGMQASMPGMKHYLNYIAPKVELGYDTFNGMYFQIGIGVDLFSF